MAFKMKGHTLPGINQRGYENMKDGRSKSSAFQSNEEKKTAQHMSFSDAQKAAEGKSGYYKTTYWDKTSDCPDCPERKIVRTLVKNKDLKKNS